MADLDAFDYCGPPHECLPRRVHPAGTHRAMGRAKTPDDRRHRLGACRGGSSGLDDESRVFAAAYCQQLGLTTLPGEVLIFCGWFTAP